MPAKRIIPCLDVKDGRVVKGVNFVGLKDAGDPVELALRYMNEGADELVFLDISASLERRKTVSQLAGEVGRALRIPYSVGGGIESLRDIENLLMEGADRVSLNSSIVKRPELITEAAKRFGSQAVVAAVDVKLVNGLYTVFIRGGKEMTGLDAIDWIREVEDRGAGEILLTSMDRDGTRSGFDLAILGILRDLIHIPVISSGGAGKMDDFLEAFKQGADACLAAGLFHSSELRIQELKKYLKDNNIEVRL